MDCVGPFPHTKEFKIKEFLLTTVCSITRFPEVIPMRKTMAATAIITLVAFFSLFVLPEVLQTDQGSNFMLQIPAT